MYEPDDRHEPVIAFSASRLVFKTRKAHECGTCKQMIPAGSEALRYTWKEVGGSLSAAYQHVNTHAVEGLEREHQVWLDPCLYWQGAEVCRACDSQRQVLEVFDTQDGGEQSHLVPCATCHATGWLPTSNRLAPAIAGPQDLVPALGGGA
jgi:hypothetical protein